MHRDPGSDPDVILETARLGLRQLTVADAEFIVELLNEPAFVRYIGDKLVRTAADARRYLLEGPIASYREHGFGLYLVERRAEREAVGMCGLVRRPGLDDVDVGFAFLARHRRRGYALEAAAAVLAHGREALGLGRIVAVTQADNTASIALLERLGLGYEGTVRLTEDGADLLLYGPTASPRGD